MTAAKTKTRRRPSQAAAELPDVVRLTTSAEPAPVEKVPLFYIDDVEYDMPARIGPNVGLKALRMARTHGADVAEAWLLEEVLGTEGYEALMNFDDLTGTQLEQIMGIVRDHVLGQEEQRAGNG